MKISKINNILMYILIWFMIYASALNYTYIPSFVSYLKDIIIFYFMTVLVIKNKIQKPKEIGKAFYILFFLVATISWIGLINNTENSKIEIIVRILKYLEFFMLFFIFTNLEKICTVSYDKLINWYIILSIILVFVHIFGYFVPNNIVSIYIDNKIGNGYYRNRISVGQPAIAVYPMIISYLYLVIFKNNNFKVIVSIIILLCGIIISVSTTGILAIIATTLIFIIFNRTKKNTKKIFYTIASLVLIFFIGIIVIKNIPKLNEIYKVQTNLLSVKIRALYNENITDISMETRDNKYNDIEKNITNIWDKIFGKGLLGYNANGIAIGSLENTFRTMKVCYGIIGLLVYIIFIAKHIIYGIKNIKNKEGMFILLFFIVFAMHSYTLEVLYLPTISYTLSLFYCYMKSNKLEKELKYENINNK